MNLTTFAPPFRLVGGYFIVGILGLMVSLFGYLKADFELISSMETAGFIHLFLVGFVMSIIIGALYQLTSVIIEKEFFSIKFGMLNLAIYTISVGLFCAGLIYSNVALMHGGGSLLFLSFLYFLTTYLLSFKGAKSRVFAYYALLFSGVLLLVGICLGFMLLFALVGAISINFTTLLSYHIYFVLGFVYMVILGASSVLVPMFALSHKTSFLLYKISTFLYFLAGVVLFFSEKFAIFIVAFSILAFIVQILMILKNRVRKAYDYWNLNILVSLAFLGLSVVLYLAGKGSFIFVLLYGFLYPFIVGHLYKIVPFLIWYHYVSPFVGKKKVPMLDEMVIKRPTYISLGLNALGVLLVVVGFEILGVLVMFVSAVLVLVNVINSFRYINFGKE